MPNCKTVQLVVCDIDGTLTHSDHSLDMRTIRAMEALHKQGVLLGLASGRPVDDLKGYRDTWHIDFPFDLLIGMNGAELWDESTQKKSTFHLLKRTWMKEIIEFMSVFDLNPFIYQDDVMVALRMDDEMKASSRRNEKQVIVTDDPSMLYAHDNAKILYRMSTDQIDEVEAYAKAHCGKQYKVFKTQPTMLEFAHVKTDKVNALRKYCEIHQIDPQMVIAFGDASNDNGILLYSGLGICLKNGTEDTKAIADLVLTKDNDEDGFADYVETHLSQNLLQ